MITEASKGKLTIDNCNSFLEVSKIYAWSVTGKILIEHLECITETFD